MDNISVSSSSTYSHAAGYSKKVQMTMTSADNPMICSKKLNLPAGNNASLRQRGLISQIAYLSTSTDPENKPSKPSKQCKTVSSISNLPGAFVVASAETENCKKSCIVDKNRTSFESPESKPKMAKAYKASKLDHTHDVLKNEVYQDEPVSKKSIHSTATKLSHKFDIFGGETEIEPPGKIAKSYKSNKLEHHYDIFKQFDPLSS